MIGSQYIPVVNADNFNIPLIYDAQESPAITNLLLTKNLISNDISFQDYDFSNTEDLNLIKYFSLGTTGSCTLSLAKKINLLSDFILLDRIALNKSFGLNEYINFDYIFRSAETLNSMPIFSLLSSQTLSLLKVLDLSKVFTISGIFEVLSISKIINLGNEIQLDYLYNLIECLLINDSNFNFDYQVDLLLSLLSDDSYIVPDIKFLYPIKSFTITANKFE